MGGGLKDKGLYTVQLEPLQKDAKSNTGILNIYFKHHTLKTFNPMRANTFLPFLVDEDYTVKLCDYRAVVLWAKCVHACADNANMLMQVYYYVRLSQCVAAC